MPRLCRLKFPVLCLALLIESLVCVPATMWFDPDFERMAEQADLIATVEITQGGTFSCKAKVDEVLKGERPSEEIGIGGFNNPNWPRSDIDKEELKTGEKLLMFLHRTRAGSPPAAYVSMTAAARSQLSYGGWWAPSPSTGDFRIKDGKIRGGWLQVSYPDSKPAVDRDKVIELVRGFVQHKAGQAPVNARSLIATELTVSKIEAISEKGDEENLRKAWLLQWLLCAQGAYGESGRSNVIFAAVRSKNALIKVCAARALLSLGNTPAVLQSVSVLLSSKQSSVQSEACQVLDKMQFDRKEVVPLLLKSLASSDPHGGGPGNIMNPLLTRRTSGRAMIIYMLTKYGAGTEAEESLVKLIYTIFVKAQGEAGFAATEEFLDVGVFQALADHFLKFPSPKARAEFVRYYSKVKSLEVEDFNDYFFRDGSREYLSAIMARIRSRPEDILYDGLPRLAERLPPGDAEFEESIFRLLQRFNGAEEARDFLPAAIAAASDRIQNLLSNYRTNELRKADNGINEVDWEKSWGQVFEMSKLGVDLKLNTRIEPPERLRGWFGILRKDYGLGFMTPYALTEIVRSTPADLRGEGVRQLREIGTKYDEERVLNAIERLGGGLSDEEEETVRRFRARYGN